MTKRRLRPDEIELWNKVTERTNRLSRAERQQALVPLKAPPTGKPQKDEPIAPFKLGQTARKTADRNNLTPTLADQMSRAAIQMDDKAYRKMRRGKMRPEGKIDLHGLTIAQAQPALTGFVLRAHTEGKRLILVITGKGKDRDEPGPIPTRTGVLRHKVPQWLAMAPMAPLVLQVTEAHLSHGGSGAYYVYLRRPR